MLRDILNLLRWQNLVFIAILMYVMEYWVSVPVMSLVGWSEQLPWWLFALLVLATMLIAAGGYVVNDYFDVKIDRINRPDKLIVTRTVTRDQAMGLFYGLTGVGVALGLAAAWVCGSTMLAGIFIITPGLLWFYSASYKRQLLIGNLIIALSSAMVPMIVAVANGSQMAKLYGEDSLAVYYLYAWVGGFALFAFLTTWIREIIKDLQDQQGDREMECHSLAIVWGEKWTKVFVTLLIVITLALIGHISFRMLPFDHAWSSMTTRYTVFGLVVPFACELVLLWKAATPDDYRSAQGLMKFIMMLGVLFGYVVLNQLSI